MLPCFEQSVWKTRRDSRIVSAWRSLPCWLATASLSLLALAGCRSQPVVAVPPSTATPTTASTEASSQSSIPFAASTLSVPTGGKTAEPVQVELVLYVHPDDLYSLQAPEGWRVSQTHNPITFSAPEGEAVISTTAFNSGYPFDSETLQRFVESQESEKALALENYVEIDQQEDPSGSSVVKTSSYYEGGILKRGIAYYQRKGPAVFMADFRVDEGIFEAYRDLFESIYSSVSVNEAATATLPVYSFDQAARHSNGLFSILVPPYWIYSHTGEENAIIETFTSPDGQAIIQTIVYDDGQAVTKELAGMLALTLLRNQYTKSITVSIDEVLADRREKLTWYSKDNLYQGVTAFTTRGTKMYLLTVIWSSDPAQYYQDLLDKVFNSYQLEDQSP